MCALLSEPESIQSWNTVLRSFFPPAKSVAAGESVSRCPEDGYEEEK